MLKLFSNHPGAHVQHEARKKIVLPLNSCDYRGFILIEASGYNSEDWVNEQDCNPESKDEPQKNGYLSSKC